jgi:hypothetical protein
MDYLAGTPIPTNISITQDTGTLVLNFTSATFTLTNAQPSAVKMATSNSASGTGVYVHALTPIDYTQAGSISGFINATYLVEGFSQYSGHGLAYFTITGLQIASAKWESTAWIRSGVLVGVGVILAVAALLYGLLPERIWKGFRQGITGETDVFR